MCLPLPLPGTPPPPTPTLTPSTMSSRRSGQLSALLLASAACVASGFGVAPPRRSAAAAAASSSLVGVPSSSTALAMGGRRGRPKGPVRTFRDVPPMNEEIDNPELRVSIMNTNFNGGKDEALGVMSSQQALAKAKELGVDLILVNKGSDPPVAKIGDYSKYRYNQDKKSKEKKKSAKSSELKEVKMSYKIGTHDYDVRKKNASKFLTQGNRVKCTVMFRGREIQHDDLGRDLLVRLSEDLTKIATMEGKPKREGRAVSCFLLPRPDVLKAVGDNKRAAEKAKKKKKEERLSKGRDPGGGDDGMGDILAATAAVAEPILNLDEDDEDDASLDELLGGDDLTDDLFG